VTNGAVGTEEEDEEEGIPAGKDEKAGLPPSMAENGEGEAVEEARGSPGKKSNSCW
jgi:hypothetical protein